MEYFVNNDILANLERLCEKDRPHGIKCKSTFWFNCKKRFGLVH